jgi:hypothetical protein
MVRGTTIKPLVLQMNLTCYEFYKEGITAEELDEQHLATENHLEAIEQEHAF